MSVTKHQWVHETYVVALPINRRWLWRVARRLRRSSTFRLRRFECPSLYRHRTRYMLLHLRRLIGRIRPSQLLLRGSRCVTHVLPICVRVHLDRRKTTATVRCRVLTVKTETKAKSTWILSRAPSLASMSGQPVSIKVERIRRVQV